MLQIAVFDRSAEHADRLDELIHSAGENIEYGVERFHSFQELIKRLREPRRLDAVFFDVTFDIDKIQLLTAEIAHRLPLTHIVFTSCYVAHAVDIADAPHIYFLVKPYESGRVQTAIAKAQKLVDESRDHLLLLPARGYGNIVLPQMRIVYFERMRRTTIVNCNEVKYETSLKLDALEELLPEQKYPAPQFIRPHNSYLVNLAYVEKIERFCLHLSNGEVLPISNQRRPMFRDGLEAFLRR